MATNRLSQPRGIDDLLLYRLHRLMSVGGAPVIRLCEGRHGITRREWRVIAVLAQHGPLRSSRLADVALLDRARTSKAVSSLVVKRLVTRSAAAGDGRLAALDTALQQLQQAADHSGVGDEPPQTGRHRGKGRRPPV